MERLQRNEFVLWEGIKLSSVEIEELKEAIDGCGPANLQAALSVVQQEQLQPLLRPLDEEAEREVRQCVRDVIALLPSVHTRLWTWRWRCIGIWLRQPNRAYL